MIFQQCLMARGESSHPGSSWKSCNTLAGIHPNRWKTHGKGWSQRDGSIRSISLVVSNNHCQTDVPIFLKHAHNSGPNMNRSWTGTVSQGGCLDISYMNGSISCRFFFRWKNHRPVFSCNGSFHQQKGLKILDPQNLPFHSWRTSHFIRLMVNFPYFCEKKRHEIDASFSRKCCHVETQPKIAGFRGRLRCCLLSESGCKQPGIQTHGNPKFGTSKITELGCHLSSGMMVEWDEIGCKESQVQSIYCIQPPKKIINL